jgi:hypothetical protein
MKNLVINQRMHGTGTIGLLKDAVCHQSPYAGNVVETS